MMLTRPILFVLAILAPLVASLTLGINLGNTLEEALERPSQQAQQRFFSAYKSAGFGLVRIPVRWDNHTLPVAPYTVNATWLARVATVVGWGTSLGLRVIVNSHDDHWLDTADDAAFAAALPRFLAIWRQVSSALSAFPPLLSFEVFNEPHQMSLASLNAMQAQVHAEVRAVSPTREVIVCGLEMDGPWWILGKGSAGLVLPTLADGSPDPHLALEVHDYSPFTFASPPLSTFSWGTAEQVREVQETFANLTAWAAARRPPPAPPLPIILGEYAVSHLQPNAKDRLLWYTTYTQAAEAAGLDAAVLWDDGGWFQTLNRTSMQWDQPVLKAIGLASLSTPDLFPEVVQDVPGRPPSTHFTAEVLVNSTWTPVYVFQTTSQPSIPSPHNGYFPLLENWTASWVSSQLPAGSPSLLLRVRRADGSPISTAVVHPASSGAQVLNISAAEGVVLALDRPGRLALDLDGELDATDTSQGYTGRPRHTFCWFVDPQLSPAQLPDPAQSSTLVVRPGEAWPTGLSPGHTVVFAPGVHHSPAPAAHGWTVYPLAAHTRYFLCAGAVVHGALVAGGSGAAWGQAGVVVGGYGVLSGEAMVRADSPDNASPQGIFFQGVVNASITGLTLVDMPNHHIVAGQSQGNELLNVKVLGWRSNGDGVHIFSSWRVADLFLRTQDDSLYLTCGGGCSAQFERITTWNDANGAAFLFSPGGGDAQAGVVLRDSDVIYSRASWFWWSGGSVFVQRGAAQGSVMSGVRVENVRVEDPLPAFNPFRLNLFGGGSTASTLRDISFSHITVANFSTIRQDQSGRALPHGIPNTLFAAPGPGVNITNVAFTNVTIAGLPMLQLVADPSAFNLSSGNLFNVTVDGVQVGAQAAHTPVAAPAASAPLGFLSANGSTLLSGGAPYRFGGINLYWLGLDENEGGVHLPTPFRITDGLTTVAGILPGTVLRSHSLGISTGGALSFEPAKGVFNASALAAADFAIAEAERLGLRVIVPLTDNWRYYHGGKHNFVEWCGQSSEELFYTDACAIAAFKEYIRQRLAHVNPYTGRAAADEPAIAMWETGNVSLQAQLC